MHLSNAGNTISLVGGNVQLNNSATVIASGGRVNVVAAAGAGELTFDAAGLLANIDLTSIAVPMGDVSIDGGGIAVGGPVGGKISIRAATLELTSSAQLLANVTGPTDSLGIDIATTGDISLAPGTIAANSFGDVRAGPISIAANGILLDGTGQPAFTVGVFSAAFAAGQGGDINIRAGSVKMLGGANILAGSTAMGNAGSVSLNVTSDVHLDGSSSLVAFALGAGQGGTVTVNSGSIELTNGASISASSTSTGDAGRITLGANSIAVDDTGGTTTIAGIIANAFNANTAARAGQISISAGSLSVTQGANITASTKGTGPAGTINLSGGSVVLDQGTSPLLTGVSAMTQNQTAGGPGGTININTASLQILGGAAVSADTEGTGPAGTINVNVSALSIDGRGLAVNDMPLLGTGLLARSFSLPSLNAAAGGITVLADTISLLNGGQINVESYSHAGGGTASITARQSFTADGRGTHALHRRGSRCADRRDRGQYRGRFPCRVALWRRGPGRIGIWRGRRRRDPRANQRFAPGRLCEVNPS